MADLTFEEIEKMRAIVAQHDQQARGPQQEFDLNKPPQVPYQYQEFPRVMFDHETKQMKKAHSPEDMEEAMKHGWSKEPFPQDRGEVVAVLDPAMLAEIKDLDERLKSKKGIQLPGAPVSPEPGKWERPPAPGKAADKPAHDAGPAPAARAHETPPDKKKDK